MLIKEEARRYADSVRTAYWGEMFPVDPFTIARALNIRVSRDSLPADTSGLIVKKPDSDPEVFVQITDSIQRQRFTVAHEIGHWVERTLVTDTPDEKFSFVEKRGGPSTVHEFFANEFGGSLLMPQDEIERLRDEGWDALRMAAYFDVSVVAMQYRLHRVS